MYVCVFVVCARHQACALQFVMCGSITELCEKREVLNPLELEASYQIRTAVRGTFVLFVGSVGKLARSVSDIHKLFATRKYLVRIIIKIDKYRKIKLIKKNKKVWPAKQKWWVTKFAQGCIIDDVFLLMFSPPPEFTTENLDYTLLIRRICLNHEYVLSQYL